MPPRDHQYYHHQHADSLEERAAVELEGMRTCSPKLLPMPPACSLLIRSLAGNDACVDCGSRHPEWATVSYGALICLECSGRHRSLGVQTSTVRSLVMDHWSHEQVLAMCEGGNSQLGQFFSRHEMESKETRYKTKGARFYRESLNKHVQKLANSGLYQGRGASRSSPPSQQQRAAPMKRCETVQ